MQNVHCMHEYITPFVTCYHSMTKPATNRPKPPWMPAVTDLSWVANHFLGKNHQKSLKRLGMKKQQKQWKIGRHHRARVSLDSSSSREVLALWTRAISFCISDFRFSDSTNIAFVCQCSWVKSSSSFCIFWTSTLPKRCSNLSLRCLIWSLQRCNSWQRFQIRGIHGYSKYQLNASCVDRKIEYGYYQILRAWVFLLWCWSQWKSMVCMQWHVYKWSEI